MESGNSIVRRQWYTPAKAERRVEQLRETGIWPGMITSPDGGLVRLTYDPEGVLDSHGYLRDPGLATW